MELYLQHSDVTAYCGDVLDVLRSLPAESVHCCVTSPPYWGLRDYGIEPSVWPNGWTGCHGLEPTPAMYVENAVTIFCEVRRVLRDDGTLWLNLGDSYSSTGGERSYGSFDGAVGRGPGARRCDTTLLGLKPKDLIGLPWLVAMALRDDGWYLRSALPWVKRSAMPDSASDRPGSALEYVFLLAKSERYYFDHDAVRRAPSGIDGGACFGGVKKAVNGDKIGSAVRTHSRHATREDRERYAATGRQIRNADLWFQSIDAPHGLTFAGDELVGLDVNTAGYKKAHFATFPPKLIEPLILASTSEHGCCAVCGKPWERVTETEYVKNRPSAGNDPRSRSEDAFSRANGSSGYRGNNLLKETTSLGFRPACTCGVDQVIRPVVFDPFLGSGTTAMVCRWHGRRCIGIERSETYLDEHLLARINTAPYWVDRPKVTTAAAGQAELFPGGRE